LQRLEPRAQQQELLAEAALNSLEDQSGSVSPAETEASVRLGLAATGAVDLSLEVAVEVAVSSAVEAVAPIAYPAETTVRVGAVARAMRRWCSLAMSLTNPELEPAMVKSP
jgi:predicted phosphoribosyltransferase